MEKFITTKKECQDKINELNNVCDRCGRKIKPIKTVDNGGSPTYWSGCFHGARDKNSFGHFTSGIKKEMFVLAEKLVCDGERYYTHNQKSEYKDSPESRLFWFQTEVSGICSLLRKIEWAKTNKPRKNKKEFLEDKYF